MIKNDILYAAQELNRLQKFVKEKWENIMLFQTKQFGLLLTNNNTINTNFLVSVNNAANYDGKVKIENKSFAIDASFRLITQEPIYDIAIPNNDKWYWMKVRYAYTNKEPGVISLSSNGTLTGSGTKFTEVLRSIGNSQYPSSIKFLNTTGNLGEYYVLSVIDDENAVLQGTNFVSETNLYYKVLGTKTPGSSLSTEERTLYRYDSCIDFTTLSGGLVEENPQGSDSAPSKLLGYEFWIARVKNNGGLITVQDKRTEFYLNRFE